MTQSPAPPQNQPLPRMLWWCLIGLVLGVLALLTQTADPASPIGATLQRAHLLMLGGWAGYWLDRALFPYDRPHQYLLDDTDDDDPLDLSGATNALAVCAGASFGQAMLRRAIVVAACVLAMAHGA